MHSDNIRAGEDEIGDDVLQCPSLGKLAIFWCDAMVNCFKALHSRKGYFIRGDANDGS